MLGKYAPGSISGKQKDSKVVLLDEVQSALYSKQRGVGDLIQQEPLRLCSEERPRESGPSSLSLCC